MKTIDSYQATTYWFQFLVFAFIFSAASIGLPPAASAFQNNAAAKSSSDQNKDAAVDFMSPSILAPEPTSVFLPPPREILRPLIRAIRIFKEGDVDRSAELIGEFLADSDTEDFLMFVRKNDGIANSVVDVANSMLSQFPESAIQSLQVRFGIPAKQRLNRAVNNRDYQEIAQVMRRFFYTRAGQDAALLMGHYHLDADHPLLAARCFQSVMDRNQKLGTYDKNLARLTGMSWHFAKRTELATEVFSQLANNSAGTLRIGDREVKFDADAPLESIEQLLGDPTEFRRNAIAQWPMLGGGPNRNARSVDGFPVLEPIWKVNTVGETDTRENIIQSRESFGVLSNSSLIPSNIPLIVDGTVLAGDGRQMRGIDFKSGKRIWTVPAKPPTKQANVNLTSTPNQLFQRTVTNNTTTPVLDSSPWTDYLKGHVSSDGQRVYRLEEASVDSNQANGPFGLQRRNYTPTTKVHWLQALDVTQQGKVVWQAGIGQKMGDPELSEISFLGCPLPIKDDLFVIGKRRQEIVLVAIKAKTGKLLWMQTLATDEAKNNVRYQRVDTTIGHSLTPSYSDGILVCPTGKDALVGVEILSRSLLWGIQANVGKSISVRSSRNKPVHSPQLVIDDSVVVGLEVGSEPRLMALDLLTGRSLLRGGKKSESAKNVLYVAGIHDASMLLVEQDYLVRVEIKSGKKIWRKKITELGKTTGRGYLTERSFYLPTDENLIVQFDLANGKIVDAILADQPFGNMVVHQGILISQTETFVACHQLDSSAQSELKLAIEKFGRLEDAPPQSIILQATLLRADNKSYQALELLNTVPDEERDSLFRREFLRNAIQLLESKSNLADEIIDGYSRQFSYQESPEFFLSYIELLVQKGRVDDVVDRLFADDQFFSIQEADDSTELILRPNRSYDFATNKPTTATTSSIARELPAHIQAKIGQTQIAFSLDQWAKAQLSAVSKTGADAKLKVGKLIDKKMKSLETASPIVQFSCLRKVPANLVSPIIRYQIAAGLLDSDHIAEAEHVLATLQGIATAPNDLSPDDAQPIDVAELTERLESLQSNQSKTAAAQTAGVPVKFNDVKVTLSSRPVQYQQNIPLDVKVVGEFAEKHLDGKSLFIWSRSKELELIDRWGNSVQRFVIATDSRLSNRNFTNGRGQLSAKHSIALLRLPNSLTAIDLSKLGQGEDPTRWRRTLSSQIARRTNFAGEIDAIIETNAHSQTATASNPAHGLCCLIDQGKLECIDAFTGQTLWQRPAPANHSQLLADSTRVFSLDSRKQSFKVFDIQTGGELETVKVPSLADVFWMGSGSQFLSATVVRESRLEKLKGLEDHRPQSTIAKSEGESNKKARSTSLKSNRVFCSFDIAKDEFVWKKRFSLQAKASRMHGNKIVVLSEDNLVYIFDSKTGKTLSKFFSGLTPAQRKQVKNLAVTKFGGRDVLLFATNRSSSQSGNGIRMRAVRSMNTFFSGFLLLVDPTTLEPTWRRPVELEGFQFLPMLPSGSPLLLFCRYVESTPTRNKPISPKDTIPRNSLQVLGIDWESGRTVVNTMAGTTNVLSISPARIDPQQGTIKFGLSSQSIQLQLRQRRDLPPAPVASVTANNPVPAKRGAIKVGSEVESPSVNIAQLNEQLVEKAKQYEASLDEKRAAETRQLELESKQ